jgi:hypothetical protein
MRLYNYQTVDKFISHYNEKNGQIYQFNEGVLGSGDWILTGLKYSFIIEETYINAWSSGHKIRKYKILPKKYQYILDNDIFN